MQRILSAILVFLFLCVLNAGTISAQSVHNVSSIAALQTAINNAIPGDQIILANGSYTTSGAITLARAGTASQPILIAAQTVGGVTISGTSAFAINSPAAFVVIRGFVFEHVGVFSVNTGTNHIQVTRNTFDNGAGGQDLNVQASDDNQLDHNLFENRPNGGQFIRLTNVGGTCAGGNPLRNWIHHNHFIHNNGGGGNGADPIENGGDSTATEQMTAEFNLIEDCNADPEAISNKSADNIIRYNTLLNNKAHIELRDGNRCQVYGNYVLNSTGIRIFGDDHQIYNNYIQGNDVGIRIGAGSDVNHICGQPFGGNDNPDRVHIYNNTLVNNTQSVLGESRTLCATDLVFANNIEQSDTGTFFQWNCTPVNPLYEGNIVWGAAGMGALPASGATRINPLLVADANGIFHISAGSPAIDASVDSFPLVVDDMDGQPRNTASDGKPPDVGADEFSSAPVTRRPLTAADVGPGAFETDFSVSATPGSQTVIAGNSTSYTITATALGGSPGTINFTVSGVPSGASASFTPTSVNNSGSSTLSVSTSGSTQPGTYTLTITAATATLAHTATVTLVVQAPPDFTLGASPSSQQIAAGNTASYTITIGSLNGFNGSVALNTGSVPSGITASINPASVTGSGTATLSATASCSIAPGTYSFTVTGTSGGLTHTTTVSLVVSAPADFSLSVNPPSDIVNPGASASNTVTVAPLNGFTGNVSLSATGLPAGATASFSPNPIAGGSGSSTLTVSTASSTPAGTYSVTIIGTATTVCGTITHSITLTLTVNPPPPPDFTVTASPTSQTVTAGAGTSYTVTVGALNGFTGTVSLTTGSLPSGVTASFNPASVITSGNSTLSIATAANASTGTFTITVTGTGGATSHSTSVQLTVNPANVCTTTTATATWNDFAFPSHSGTFTATFDATPSVANQSSAVGLSQGAQTTYTGFANIVVFTPAGTIQARNGGGYAGPTPAIPFSAGVTYHFRLAINVTAHTYSIFVTPAGGSELTVGSGFAFRTEQNTVTSLDHWGSLVNVTPGGTLQVCNFTVQ